MPDIAMCPGTDCPIRETCYRFTAKPTPGRQSYFEAAPFDKADGDCLYHLPIYDKKPSTKGAADGK